MLGQHRHELGIGVEHPVHVADVTRSERRGQNGRIAIEPVPATEPGVVGDVAGRLLEVRHEPTPLEHLGQDVRGLLAREVHPTELGHGVVAVLDEDLVVERLGALEAHGGIDAGVTRDVEVVHELVEKQASQRLGRPRIPREQGALRHFRQVDEREHGPVEVGEIAAENRLLSLVEVLSDVGGHVDRG